MNYPLISEYIEAIKSADNFKELMNLRPVIDDDGQPIMTSGNFSVVFKMKNERDGKFYALKCFIREQEGRAEAYRQITEELKDVKSSYLVSIHYFDKELYVDTKQTTETEFPVLLMDWVEGKTLDKYLRENLDDKFALEMLAYRFSQLAQWLIPQSFAHGDLKPDNILVREDGSLVLVDYDGMYVPAMKGQKARELGSPDYRHPHRTEDDFDEQIDDFPFISILLSLKAISLNPLLLAKYGNQDCLLLSSNDYRDFSKSKVIEDISDSYDVFMNFIIHIYLDYVEVKPYLKYELQNFLKLKIEQPKPIINSHTSIDYYEWKYRVKTEDIDKGCSIYSHDGLKLFKFYDTIAYGYTYGEWDSIEVGECVIKEGTKVICDNAIQNNIYLEKVIIPPSVEFIGKNSFKGCHFTYIELPTSISYIDKDAFEECHYLRAIIIPKGTIARFASMLPNNISQLIEINITQIKDDICTSIRTISQQKQCTPYNIFESLFMKGSQLYSYIGYEDVEFSILKKRCCIDFKLPIKLFLFGDRRHYNIEDINSISEIANIIYHIIIDLGNVELLQDVNNYINVKWRRTNIFRILENI